VSVPDSPVQEDELHAFVDGRLPADRLAAVERYLHANPEEARRINAYMHQRAALRAALLSDVEPVPPHLRPANILRERVHRSRTTWQFAAGVVLALGLGVGGGWVIWGPASPSANERAMKVLVQQGFATYSVFAPDVRHPIEVPAAERTHLTQWLSNRLQRPVTIPDLSRFGYTLLGGRLVATEQGGASALIMYAGSEGQRVSLLLRPMRAEFHSTDQEHSERAMQLCAWITNGLGYALVGPKSDASLEVVADQIRDDLGQRG